MELIEGNYYSPHDLQTFMEVSESTWSHRRNELLSNLSLYYDYEVEYEGRKTTFHILKKLGDYQGIPNKRDASKRNNTYRSKIVEVIKADNVQTASNVARIIKDDSEIQELNHKFGTVQEYIRLRMREMFGKYQNDGGTDGRILEKIWCRLDLEHNCYIPMPEDQIQAFYEFFYAERKASAPIELDALNDYEIGLITKEDMTAIIGQQAYFGYANARREFKAKYGYTPVKVPVYGIYGFDITNFESEDNNNVSI